jgi:hypothetical protein
VDVSFGSIVLLSFALITAWLCVWVAVEATRATWLHRLDTTSIGEAGEAHHEPDTAKPT